MPAWRPRGCRVDQEIEGGPSRRVRPRSRFHCHDIEPAILVHIVFAQNVITICTGAQGDTEVPVTIALSERYGPYIHIRGAIRRDQHVEFAITVVVANDKGPDVTVGIEAAERNWSGDHRRAEMTKVITKKD